MTNSHCPRYWGMGQGHLSWWHLITTVGEAGEVFTACARRLIQADSLEFTDQRVAYIRPSESPGVWGACPRCWRMWKARGAELSAQEES